MSSSIVRVRWAPIVAVTLGVLVIGAAPAHVSLDLLTHQLRGGEDVTVDWITAVGFSVPAAVTGAVVAARRPGNPLGWLLLALFLLGGTPTADYAFLDYGMHHGTLPLGRVAVAVALAWPVWLFLITLLLWLFPDGRLPRGRWRRVAVTLVAAGAVLSVVASVGNYVAVAGHAVPISASGNVAANASGVWGLVENVLVVGIGASCLVWLIVQVPKYRRSAGERRQQLKWLYSGAVALVVSAVISAQTSGDSSSYWQVVGTLGLAILPVCVGVAVLKYRLYAIDRIISRVISYAIVTAVLAGVFAGLVLLATEVLPFKTPVAVAGGTLVAAALFNPLRRRVQHAVDRRFNRARYDAETLVAAFTARLQQTVDLDTVQGDLVSVIDAAFQPAHMSVWLPPRLRPGVVGVNAASTPIAARTQAISLGGTQGAGTSTTIRSAKKGFEHD
jgi:hypothetical protein